MTHAVGSVKLVVSAESLDELLVAKEIFLFAAKEIFLSAAKRIFLFVAKENFLYTFLFEPKAIFFAF